VGREDDVNIRVPYSGLSLLAALAGLLLASCTSKGSTGPARPTPSIRIHGANGSASPGAESIKTGAAREKCTITTMAAIGRTFRARGVSESVGRTGIGNPICRFTVRSSNLGAPGTVTVSLTPHASATTFHHAQQGARGAVVISSVGDRAFYVLQTGTLQMIKGSHRVVVQAGLHVPAGPSPKPLILRRDLVAIGRSIAADL
jgi:hypothetical protein